MNPQHFSDYDREATERCERTLVTLLGDIGPWSKRVFLAGGLAPRYIVGQLPEDQGHIGTTDVDLVIGLALDEAPETYRTLENNLKKSGFTAGATSFQWVRNVDGVKVMLEFLCETTEVEPGRIFKPKGEGAGSGLGAFNARGAQLVSHDYIEREIEATRLDRGGKSKVVLRVAGVLPYTVLKIFAFQDRHNTKDAYDVVFTLLHFGSGPAEAGAAAAASPVSRHPTVDEALRLLAERFADIDQDGPVAYAQFLAPQDDEEAADRFRREAVAVVDEFLKAFRRPSG